MSLNPEVFRIASQDEFEQIAVVLIDPTDMFTTRESSVHVPEILNASTLLCEIVFAGLMDTFGAIVSLDVEPVAVTARLPAASE